MSQIPDGDDTDSKVEDTGVSNININDIDIDSTEAARVIPPFNLQQAIVALQEDDPQLMSRLHECEEELRTVRERIISQARQNFVLERDLAEIDEKIKVLVKNQMFLETLMSAHTASENKDSNHSPLAGKRELYEDLFYLLQLRTSYFARLASLVNHTQISSFVQTVVFDMYGDQYDTREERLLLDLFRKVLKLEIFSATSKGSLLRNNTAITQMLSAYAKRGQGFQILRDILAEPLQKIVTQKDLNLEINPSTIYSQIVAEYETNTGKVWEQARTVESAVAAEHPQVQAILAKRGKLLEEYVEMILQRIVNAVDSIPYGMRWVCKQLGLLSKLKFPDLDRYQVGSFIGGFLYLRFINPAIVTPDAQNVITQQVSKIARRNLTLIAKVLQAMSNGVIFGGKEAFMSILNPYVQRQRDVLHSYFERLTTVDDMADALQVDRVLEHTSGRINTITISYNQIFLCHSLLNEHLTAVAPDPNDPIRPILVKLGKAPAPVARSEDRTVGLQLADRRQTRLSTVYKPGDDQGSQRLELLAKQLLERVVRILDKPVPATVVNLTGFFAWLEQVNAQEPKLVAFVQQVRQALELLYNAKLIEVKGSRDEAFDAFFWNLALEAMERSKRVDSTKKRLSMATEALKTITLHHELLKQRKDVYIQYLENARKGQAQITPESKDNKKKKAKSLKFTHSELEALKIISRVDPNIPRSILKACTYQFDNVAPGRFEISLKVKKGIEVNLLSKPIVLVLEDLLRQQEKGDTNMTIEAVDLNVNLLIHLFNTKFLNKD